MAVNVNACLIFLLHLQLFIVLITFNSRDLMAKRRKTSDLAVRCCNKKVCRTKHVAKDGKARLASDRPTTRSSKGSALPDSNSIESNLLKIPQELLECISGYLDGLDFGALRLTCRAVAKRVEYVFTQKFFTDKSFLISDKLSRITLYAISQHEKYSRSMKCIRFVTGRLRPLSLEVPRLEDRLERRTRRDLKREHEKLLREEEELYQDWSLAKTFKTIFLQFKKMGNFPKIRIRPLNPETDLDPKPWGWRRLQNITGSSAPAFHDRFTVPVFHRDLVVGLYNGGYETDELQLGQSGCELRIRSFGFPTGNLPSANLRRLELWLCSDIDEYGYVGNYVDIPIRQHTILAFTQFLARAQQLEHLLLHLEPVHYDEDAYSEQTTSLLYKDVFHSIATKTYMNGELIELDSDDMLLPNLKSIDLKNHQIHWRELRRFCRARKRTLKCVKMRNIIDMEADLRCTRVASRLRRILGAGSEAEPFIDIADTCYSGNGWDDLLEESLEFSPAS